MRERKVVHIGRLRPCLQIRRWPSRWPCCCACPAKPWIHVYWSWKGSWYTRRQCASCINWHQSCHGQGRYAVRGQTWRSWHSKWENGANKINTRWFPIDSDLFDSKYSCTWQAGRWWCTYPQLNNTVAARWGKRLQWENLPQWRARIDQAQLTRIGQNIQNRVLWKQYGHQ